MDDNTKAQLIAQSWQIHSEVEQAYRAHPASDDDPLWLEKQRLLLADMAMHLLQTALGTEALSQDALRNNLHAILTVSDAFLPHAKLKQATAHLYQDSPDN